MWALLGSQEFSLACVQHQDLFVLNHCENTVNRLSVYRNGNMRMYVWATKSSLIESSAKFCREMNELHKCRALMQEKCRTLETLKTICMQCDCKSSLIESSVNFCREVNEHHKCRSLPPGLIQEKNTSTRKK